MRKKVLLSIGAIILTVFICVTGFIEYYYNRMNIKKVSENTGDPVKEEISDLLGNSHEDKDIVSKLDKTIENLKADKTEIPFNDDVFNILLIGNDSRNETSDQGRSDSMILVSINRKLKSVHLTSFMRDIYIKIPGYGNNRLNAAYAYGGENLLKETLKESFKIHIDRYVKVGFEAFEDIIDFCGGIDNIPLTKKEIEVMNTYIQEINALNEDNLENGKIKKLKEGGLYSLSGKQALAYARVRYVVNGNERDDFGRTARQRTILLALTEKAKNLNVFELNKLMKKILPQITTDLKKGELISLLLDYMDYKKYETISQRIPVDGSYEALKIGGKAVIGVNFEANIRFLHTTIYGNNNKEQE